MQLSQASGEGGVVMAVSHEDLWKMSKSPSLCSTAGMGCGEKEAGSSRYNV